MVNTESRIKPGSLVVWGLVDSPVAAEVLVDDDIDGWQVAELRNTGSAVLVKVTGETRQRWSIGCAQVEVREMDTVVRDGAIVAAVGEQVKVRNPVTRWENVEGGC